MSYHLETVCRKNGAIYRQIYAYYNYCESIRQMSRVTMASKVYSINDFVCVTKLSDLRKIRNQHINTWINAQRQRNNSGRSINDRLAHLKAMLRWQRDMDLRMPQLKLGLIPKVAEVPARKVCFSRYEVEQVLKYANELDWLIISLCFDCGLRISELRNLKPCHLHGDRLYIIGKGRKSRHVFLRHETQLRLFRWLKQHHDAKFFWESPLRPGEPLTTYTLRIHMKQCFKRAGIEDFCPHDLRHSYATDLKHLGVSTRHIQAALGHATEAVTEKYLSDLEGFDLREVYQIKYSRTM